MTPKFPHVLRRGDTSPVVALVQQRLRELRYFPQKQVATRHFGPITEAAVKAVQKTHKDQTGRALEVDGVVGEKTWTALWAAPSERVVVSRPGTLHLRGQDARIAFYGHPDRIAVRLGQVTSELDFRGHKVPVHDKALPYFRRWLELLSIHERAHKLEPWTPRKVATYSHRLIRGGTTWSFHAFAAALDVDWDRNPMTSDPGAIARWRGSSERIPEYVIDCARRAGLTWGGDWSSRKDFMHFQAG